jgi:hypothetical protein
VENAAADHAFELEALFDERRFTKTAPISAPSPCGKALLIVQLSALPIEP